MPRKNSTRRQPQARRRADGTAFRRTPPPPPVEVMVIPAGRCPRNRKLMFAAADVEKALRQARASRIAKGSTHTEERSYLCEHCDHHHLTSRTEYQERTSR